MTITFLSPAAYPYEKRWRNPNWRSAALLVIDMQIEFSSIANPILPAVNSTIELCRAASIPIFFFKYVGHHHTLHNKYWCPHKLLKNKPRKLLQNSILTSEQPQSSIPITELVPGLSCHHEVDKIISKSTYSAFLGTRLEEDLKKKGVEEVIITGLFTNICCETTARDAFDLGFRVFFSADATGTGKYRGLQESTLKNMAYGFAYIIDCERLQGAFSNEDD